MANDALDDLYARWQRNPDVAQTTALCEALVGRQRPDLVEIVGKHASQQAEVRPLVAAARMYTAFGRLDEAQGVLISAGRIDPRDGSVYRWLGEVLLRRGDAQRAERVLERAVQFGGDGMSRALLEKAKSLVPVQDAAGPQAVAAEAASALQLEKPTTDLGIQRQPLVPDLGVQRAPLASESDSEMVTKVRDHDSVEAAMAAALAPLSDPLLKMQTRGNEPLDAPPAAPKSSAPLPAFDMPSTPDPGRPIQPASSKKKIAIPVNPALLEASGRKPNGAIPEARDVLDALQSAGIYDPSSAGAQVYNWAKPERTRRLFSTVTLAVLAVVLVGGGFGTYRFVNDRRAKEHVEAEGLLAQVDKDLETSDPKLLEPAEKSISRAFELESRSQHAALTWLHERALVGLLRGGADIAFEDATQRARAVGVEEKRIAFASVASFLFQGDTAGAAATVAKWDTIAADDAWFQLIAGAAFERAGDPRSVERYGAAVKLAPELFVAQVLLTRATAIDGDPRRAADLAKDLRTRHPARAEGAALVALVWTRDPGADMPPELTEVTEKGDTLPITLRAVPHAARAVLALHKGAVDDARPFVQKGLDVADSPGIAAWLGSIALTMGDENLARKAALTAVSFSAVYPPARVLAARVALLGARLDEALKAAEDLPPTSADVAVVTAAVAYERMDGERMSRAFEAVADDAKKRPFAVPLLRGQALLAGNLGVLSGDKAKDMSDDEAPWADIVAMDWALDGGDVDLAKKIAEQWRREPRSMHAVRLARLARYEGKLEDADRLSKAALETGTVTMRVLSERVFTLVALKRDADALALFKAYPNVGGPLAKWLRAYAVAAHGKHDEARAIVSQEDPPPAAAAMPARLIAASAYAMMKDTRKGPEYVRPIIGAGFANPDVAFAAEKLGLPKPLRRR